MLDHPGIKSSRNIKSLVRAAGVDYDDLIAEAERRQAGAELSTRIFCNQYRRERGVREIVQGVIPYNPAHLQVRILAHP